MKIRMGLGLSKANFIIRMDIYDNSWSASPSEEHHTGLSYINIKIPASYILESFPVTLQRKKNTQSIKAIYFPGPPKQIPEVQ